MIKFLHNHHKMITMNPLVADYFALAEEESKNFFKHEHPDHKPPLDYMGREIPVPVYSITDDMTRPGRDGQAANGGWTKKFVPEKITYSASMRNLSNGLLSVTHAPMGIHSVTTWLVKETYDGQLVIEERGLMTSNRLLMGFIKSTLHDSHDKLLSDIVTELINEAERENNLRTRERARHGRGPSFDNTQQQEQWETRYSRDMGKSWI